MSFDRYKQSVTTIIVKIWKYFLPPKVPLNPFSVCLLLSPQSLTTSDIYFIPIVLSFLECQINGLIQYVVIHRCLFPHSRCFRDSSTVLLYQQFAPSTVEQYSIVSIHYNLFLNLSCFQQLAIMNIPIMCIYMQVLCGQVFSCLLEQDCWII